MTLDEFEQLVSSWLDNPELPDLIQRIDAAIAARPAWAAIRDQWRRLARLDRLWPAPTDPGDLRARVRAAIGGS